MAGTLSGQFPGPPRKDERGSDQGTENDSEGRLRRQPSKNGCSDNDERGDAQWQGDQRVRPTCAPTIARFLSPVRPCPTAGLRNYKGIIRQRRSMNKSTSVTAQGRGMDRVILEPVNIKSTIRKDTKGRTSAGPNQDRVEVHHKARSSEIAAAHGSTRIVRTRWPRPRRVHLVCVSGPCATKHRWPLLPRSTRVDTHRRRRN